MQWLVQRFRSERLRVRSRRSAIFTPSAHVRRQSLPVWPPTLNNHLYLYSKKRKNTTSFMPSLGAGVQPRSTVQLFVPVSDVEKRSSSQFCFLLWRVIWWGKAFRDQQCQFLTRNRSLSRENESNCSMTSECVRTDSILLRGASHGKEICSIYSRSRVLAHRPCPKLEMFCPSVLQLFYGCSKVLMTNHGMSFFFFFFLTGWRSELSYPSIVLYCIVFVFV